VGLAVLSLFFFAIHNWKKPFWADNWGVLGIGALLLAVLVAIISVLAWLYSGWFQIFGGDY
jgi:hypothetical protein